LIYSVKYEDFGLRDYKETWDYQEKVFQKIINRKSGDTGGKEGSEGPACGTLIFVEHPHVYTLGKSGSEDNLLLNFIQLRAKDAGFYRINRGGDITYHGPGQLVGYPILDLEVIGVSLKDYVHGLEEAVIRTVAGFGISAGRLEGATGVWLNPDLKARSRKICAIGIRASRYVTMHGFALNVNTNLEYFSFINPCGFTDKGVTSMEKELGASQDIEAVKERMKKNLAEIFNLSLINN